MPPLFFFLRRHLQCGPRYDMQMVGFIIQRYNEVRDLEAKLLRTVCCDVVIEPVLQNITGEDEFLVSKETVVRRRWERSKQKFGFIKRVDKG